jgi:hypothetical protein
VRWEKKEFGFEDNLNTGELLLLLPSKLRMSPQSGSALDGNTN